MNYLRAATLSSGLLTAIAEVVHAGRRQAVAEARLHDATGRLCATASTTCLLFELPRAQHDPVIGATASASDDASR